MDTKQKSKKELKVEEVKSLSEKIATAKTITFADYHGLTAEQIRILRTKIKNLGGELIVTKNTLIKRALESSKFKVQSSKFKGPTATIFAYEDEIAPIKEIVESAKSFGSPKVKFGFLEKDFLDAERIEALSKIPSPEVLKAKVVGALSSPIYGIVNVLSANIRNLVIVLNEATKKV